MSERLTNPKKRKYSNSVPKLQEKKAERKRRKKQKNISDHTILTHIHVTPLISLSDDFHETR